MVRGSIVSLGAAIPSRAEQRPRARQIGRSIDAERNRVNERHPDAHAGLERAQLLEPLPALERARRQGCEALQRRPPIGIDADVVPDRARAGRRASRA